MPVICQHCGTEAPDDRVMCPNCRRRLRAPGETPPAEPTPATAPQPAPTGYGDLATAAPWTAPVVAAAGEPPRPDVRFARDVTVRANRLTVAFRLILAIPHFVVIYALNIGLEVIGFISWFAALFTGRVPDGLQQFMVGVIGWQVRVGAYVGLLTDEYPPFALEAPNYPVRYSTTHERLNRAAVFFRIILVIPAAALLYFVGIGYVLVAVIAWFIVLIRGRMPEPLFDAFASVQRYYARTSSYLWLVTPAYPAGLFKEAPSAYGDEPQPSEPQPPRQTRGAKRLLVLFIVLGVLGLGGAISGGVVAGANQAHKVNQLRHAHDDLVATIRSTPNCGGAGALSCFRQAGQRDAAAFRTFQSKLDGLHFGGVAREDRDQLLDTTASLIRAYDGISRASSEQEVSNLIDSTNLDSLLSDWNDGYRTLYDDLRGNLD